MRPPTAYGLVLVLAAAVLLASCGGGDDAQLLPGETSQEITANLDAVEQLADEGDCTGAEGAAEQVSAQVEELKGVDQELLTALQRGATRLNEVVASCEEETTEAIEPASAPETTETTEAEEEKTEKEREKEEREAEKEAEKAEKEAEKEAEKVEASPPAEVPPPNSNGQGKGPSEGGEGSSGGISPGDAVEEDE